MHEYLTNLTVTLEWAAAVGLVLFVFVMWARD